MADETKLKQIYRVVTDSWKLYKAHTGASPIDWAAVVAESDRILDEAGNANTAFYILHGFLQALEEEEQQVHGKSTNGS